LPLLSPPHRPRRTGEWTDGAAIAFLATLAAHKSVTLAARAACMSRKSAYALKARDSAFAEAWTIALAAPPFRPVEGDTAKRAALSTSSTASPTQLARNVDAIRRDRFFAALRESNGVRRQVAAASLRQ
jgi:hypothetical protein